MLSDSEIPMKSGNFSEYLQQKGYAQTTITRHQKNLERFEKWCYQQNISWKNANYHELLSYLRFLNDKNTSKATICNYFNGIRKYYNYLVITGKLKYNHAKDIRIRNSGKKVIRDILTPEQLDQLYQDYANRPEHFSFQLKKKMIYQRNLVILGLMVYQGLLVGELRKLEATHIDLTKGSIYVPSTKRSNSRILKLQAVQILSIHQYISETRPKLLEMQNIKTEYLFFGKQKLLGIIEWLICQLKQQNPLIKNVYQIRSSVIMHWISQYNIRQVQYMAGHKYISATERYRNEDMRDLQKQLEKYHPLK